MMLGFQKEVKKPLMLFFHPFGGVRELHWRAEHFRLVANAQNRLNKVCGQLSSQ